MKGDFIRLRDFIAARGTILNVGLLIHYLIYGHLTIKFREFSRPDFYNNSSSGMETKCEYLKKY